jgi:hypothetical protein
MRSVRKMSMFDNSKMKLLKMVSLVLSRALNTGFCILSTVTSVSVSTLTGIDESLRR